jgi:hypothetical protein
MREPPLRSLIAVTWASYIAAYFLANARWGLSPEVHAAINQSLDPWLALQASAPYLLWTIWAVVAVLILGSVAGSIGMMFYRRWARSLSLWMTVAATLAAAYWS